MTSTPCPRCQTLEALLREVRPYLNRDEVSSGGELYTKQRPPTGVLGEIAQRIDRIGDREKSPRDTST